MRLQGRDHLGRILFSEFITRIKFSYVLQSVTHQVKKRSVVNRLLSELHIGILIVLGFFLDLVRSVNRPYIKLAEMFVLVEPFDRILEHIGEHWDVQDLSSRWFLLGVKFGFPLSSRLFFFFDLIIWW